MIFGIPRELKDHETRVGAGLIPRNVATLIAQGHTVYFQKGVMEPPVFPMRSSSRLAPSALTPWKRFMRSATSSASSRT